MTVLSTGKIASKHILLEVDADFTYCWQNRPRNYFAVNGEIGTAKCIN